MIEASDRATLDAQYNNRALVPDHQRHLDAFARDSAALREVAEARLDLAYGDGPKQAIDLFLPPACGDAPLLVFIHGGYWQGLDRKDFSFVAKPFLAAGTAVAVIGYDLAPAVDMDRIADQVRDALIWLHRHGAAHGAHGDRLVVTGHSAGGHLTAMALATDWERLGAPGDLIAAGAPISGLFDLEPIRRCYLNEVLGLDPAQAARLSPLHLPPHGKAPVLVTVGGDESEAFLDQSARYAAHLQGGGIDVAHAVQPGLNHFTVVRALADPSNPATRWLVDAVVKTRGHDRQ
jgi:arylformamidase